ncbi:MAG: ABC transporter ATP-binding protein [Actinomycetota bacterium]|nr:ABC transporter ATP-binding protein [Actinomycetota bacterium]
MTMSSPLLEVGRLVAGYGSGVVLHGASITVSGGEIVCLLGPNGAGKSTLMRTIAGLLKAQEGTVHFSGTDVTSLPAHQRARRGLSLVPEERSAFADLTVDQNLTVGAIASRGGTDKSSVEDRRLEVFDLFPRLHERRSQRSGTLSGGEQKMLVIGRSLMSAPILLLVDEPSQGLAPQALAVISAALQRLRTDHGISILIAEQNTSQALGWADRAYVLSGGRVSFEGAASDLQADDALMQRLYLGDDIDT